MSIARRPDYQVIISGAGPGGVCAALRLLQRDPALTGRILILDRSRFPRPKPCGGGLTGHALDAMQELDIKLNVSSYASPTGKVRFGEFVRDVPLQRPVHVVRREEFDHSLVELARTRGAHVSEGEGLDGFSATSDQVTVRTSRSRELNARVLIGADGAGSLVRKRLCRGRKVTPHRFLKLELALSSDHRCDPAMLYDFTPMRNGLRGYLWVFPVPGRRVNVGVMQYPSRINPSRAELTDILRVGLAEHGLDMEPEAIRCWPAWGYDPAGPVSASRVVTIGDAAGIDALTGEGIAVAMEHAIIAGDAIIEAMKSGDFAFANYRRRLRRAVVGRELILDSRLASLTYGGKHRWRSWLPMVLFDRQVLEMYAARVCGTETLADQPGIYLAILRHLIHLPMRRRLLRRYAETEIGYQPNQSAVTR